MSSQSSPQALGAYIQSLRLAAGMEVSVLARRASLSTAQIAELESGADRLFYNPAIRQQAAHKLIRLLGGDVSQWPGEPLAPASSLPLIPPVPLVPRLPEPRGKMPSPQAPRRTLVVAGLLLAVLLGVAWQMGTFGQFAPASDSQPSASSAADAAQPALAQAQPEAQPTRAAPAAAPTSASTPAPAAPLVQVADASAPSTCAPPTGDAPSVQPPQARKPGDMVYVLSPVSQLLCVSDATGKLQAKRLEPGQGHSFYGQAPWRLQSSQLAQTQVYFQGWKVPWPAELRDRVDLVELR